MDVQNLLDQRETAIAFDVVVTRDGLSRFAVVDMMTRFLTAGSHPFPQVLYAGFRTEKAAELARQDCIAGMADPTHGSPYGPSEVTVEMWEEAASNAQQAAEVATPETRETIAARFGVEADMGGFRVSERPSTWAGEFIPCRFWSPPMKSDRAAELAMDEIVSDLAMGLDPEAECRKDGVFEHCERLAGLLTYLEKHNVPHAEELAKKLARDEPWRGWPRHFEDSSIPF